MPDWLLLTASLPTSPSAIRVRIWRALKATGCASLRDGVYLLPAAASTADDLRAIERAIRDAGTDAHLLEVAARDARQQADFVALFDRSEAYAELMLSLKDVRPRIKAAADADMRKLLRGLQQQGLAIGRTDFFPGKAAARAQAALDALQREIEQRLSPGEPAAQAGTIMARSAQSLVGKLWATRKRPWLDRLATAWLVRRFIDPQARFTWLASPDQCPKRAIGFDFDGATFTHVDGLVTFEVLAHSLGLLATDAALKRVGDLVHDVDVGGLPIAEAAGIETLVRGLHAQHDNDDHLLDAAMPLLDTLYAAYRAMNPAPNVSES